MKDLKHINGQILNNVQNIAIKLSLGHKNPMLLSIFTGKVLITKFLSKENT